MASRVSAAGQRAAAEPQPAAFPRIGGRLRAHRLQRQLSLKALAEAAGCSESLVSRIENNLVNPSLTTLHRLCQALGIGRTVLLEDGAPVCVAVYGPKDRVTLGGTKRHAGESSENLVPYAPDRRLQASVTILPPKGGWSGPFQHEGEEVGYIIEGTLEIVVDGQSYTLGAGASFFFESALDHRYRNAGRDECRIVWVNTPPTF